MRAAWESKPKKRRSNTNGCRSVGVPPSDSLRWARAQGTIGQGFHKNAGRGELGQGNGGNPNTFPALGLAQGFETILAEPRGTRRIEAVNNLDLRVQATVRLGGRRIPFPPDDVQAAGSLA